MKFGITHSILTDLERRFLNAVFDSLVKHLPNSDANYDSQRLFNEV